MNYTEEIFFTILKTQAATSTFIQNNFIATKYG